HIEENEDPAQAVEREAYEETGIRVEVSPTAPRFKFDYPAQIPAPLTILEEDIDDPISGPHKHVDFIYVLRPLAQPPKTVDGWQWVARGALERMTPLRSPDGEMVPPPEDVAELGLIALDTARAWR
ncbi:MAG: NUDIX domain-containing protein, partial [Chloroflexi bacterium]|nr:NUDIX domain-containing protein [Chloroflexota bacterium]